MGRYVVWGHGKSWIVHWHDGIRITWTSRWCSSKAEANRVRTEVKRRVPRRSA